MELSDSSTTHTAKHTHSTTMCTARKEVRRRNTEELPSLTHNALTMDPTDHRYLTPHIILIFKIYSSKIILFRVFRLHLIGRITSDDMLEYTFIVFYFQEIFVSEIWCMIQENLFIYHICYREVYLPFICSMFSS